MDIYVIWAGLLGALSAMSLLIGSLIGVGMRLPRAAVGMLAAFGADDRCVRRCDYGARARQRSRALFVFGGGLRDRRRVVRAVGSTC